MCVVLHMQLVCGGYSTLQMTYEVNVFVRDAPYRHRTGRLARQTSRTKAKDGCGFVTSETVEPGLLLPISPGFCRTFLSKILTLQNISTLETNCSRCKKMRLKWSITSGLVSMAQL